MAQKTKDGGSAYPTTDDKGKVTGGMTKREMMAQGCMRTASALHPDGDETFIARKAVRLADALLKALDG